MLRLKNRRAVSEQRVGLASDEKLIVKVFSSNPFLS
jgi:hypothetical protein